MLDFLARLPLLNSANRILGGFFGFVEVYLIAFILLFIASLVPAENIQAYYKDSWLAQGMVENTPVFSEAVKDLWMKNNT
jgi:uncharacterized membrane protein required for colicin V production